MDSATCQILGPAYIPECALVMSHAFANSPAYLYILQDLKSEQERVDALHWIFSRNLEITIRKCPSALRGILKKSSGADQESDEVICCCLWTPYPYQKITMFEMICAGLLEIPIRFGWGSFRRLLESVKLSKHEALNDDEKNDFITLERMVVKPEYQGRGYGSHALRSLLVSLWADSDDNKSKEIPTRHKRIHLSTQEARNVTFYRRLGFCVVQEFDVVDKDSDPSYSFHNWDMCGHMNQVIDHMKLASAP